MNIQIKNGHRRILLTKTEQRQLAKAVQILEALASVEVGDRQEDLESIASVVSDTSRDYSKKDQPRAV